MPEREYFVISCIFSCTKIRIMLSPSDRPCYIDSKIATMANNNHNWWKNLGRKNTSTVDGSVSRQQCYLNQLCLKRIIQQCCTAFHYSRNRICHPIVILARILVNLLSWSTMAKIKAQSVEQRAKLCSANPIRNCKYDRIV